MEEFYQVSANKLAVTVDIEDWYHIPSVTGSPFSVYSDVNEFFANWHGRYDYLTEPTQKALSLLDEYGITATFFVVANVIEKYPGLVESIVEKGHEIGCHGLHHACKINPRSKKKALMKINEFEECTLKAKRILEETCGDEVIGYRAPNAYIGKWMFASLDKMGFEYDSSVSANSLYNKTDMPLQDVSSYPYYPIENNTQFVEFPWANWDIFGLKIPTSGGPMLRFLGANIILKGLKQSLGRGHTIFYFHPIDMSDKKFPNVAKLQKFFWIFKGKIVEKRIRYILNKLRSNNVKFSIIRDLMPQHDQD